MQGAGIVLDASALLAYLRQEAGWEAVVEALDQPAAISIVNLAEVLSKGAEAGFEPRLEMAALEREGILGIGRAAEDALVRVEPYELEDMLETARLRPLTRPFGLSIGDRACLATASRLGAAVLTADRRWNEVPGLAVSVRVIR